MAAARSLTQWQFHRLLVAGGPSSPGPIASYLAIVQMVKVIFANKHGMPVSTRVDRCPQVSAVGGNKRLKLANLRKVTRPSSRLYSRHNPLPNSSSFPPPCQAPPIPGPPSNSICHPNSSNHLAGAGLSIPVPTANSHTALTTLQFAHDTSPDTGPAAGSV